MARGVIRLPLLTQCGLRNTRSSLHTLAQSRKAHSLAVDNELPPASTAKDGEKGPKSDPPLSLLPLSNLLRSYAITSISSISTVMKPSLRLMSILANSTSPFLNPDSNPLLHFLLKRTIYNQFCAGETSDEVVRRTKELKRMGYKGVILAYGKEIVLEKGEKVDVKRTTTVSDTNATESAVKNEIRAWQEGTITTIDMTPSGDHVALKFTGAGREIMRQLAAGENPDQAMEAAIMEVCERAKHRNVGLLFDAEQDAVQKGIDAWTLEFARRFNRDKAVVYGTYQAYLRSTPQTLAEHLATAQQDGFILGVKLVRGAYMSSDPPQIFWNSKKETDDAYNGIAEALVEKTWNSTLKAPRGNMEMPEVGFVLATHNSESVQKCMAIQRRQTQNGEKKISMAYGQLLGIAEDISCELVMADKVIPKAAPDQKSTGPSAYQYCVWGSVGECLKYLIRRAEENRDAMGHAHRTRLALGRELRRRTLG